MREVRGAQVVPSQQAPCLLQRGLAVLAVLAPSSQRRFNSRDMKNARSPHRRCTSQATHLWIAPSIRAHSCCRTLRLSSAGNAEFNGATGASSMTCCGERQPCACSCGRSWIRWIQSSNRRQQPERVSSPRARQSADFMGCASHCRFSIQILDGSFSPLELR